jgi:hypothetical protein
VLTEDSGWIPPHGRRQTSELSVRALTGAVRTKCWYREAMPSERNVTDRQTIAGRLNLDLAIRGRLHGRDQIGSRAFPGRWCGLYIRHRRRCQGLHESVLDVLKSATFHAFHDQRLKLRSVNFYRHCDRPVLFSCWHSYPSRKAATGEGKAFWITCQHIKRSSFKPSSLPIQTSAFISRLPILPGSIKWKSGSPGFSVTSSLAASSLPS